MPTKCQQLKSEILTEGADWFKQTNWYKYLLETPIDTLVEKYATSHSLINSFEYKTLPVKQAIFCKVIDRNPAIVGNYKQCEIPFLSKKDFLKLIEKETPTYFPAKTCKDEVVRYYVVNMFTELE